MTPDDAMTELVAQAQELKMYPMTIQQITDRLAEEAGWTSTAERGPDDEYSCIWTDKHGRVYGDEHPFPPDSIDAAVRAVPEGMLWSVGSKADGFTALVDDHGKMSVAFASHPAHALYFASAKARGWM